MIVWAGRRPRLREMSVAEIMRRWRPGSFDPPWDWDDEAADLRSHVCACCDQPGHYQAKVEEKLRAEGPWWSEATIMLGPDGRVWDGHHRIVAAHALGIESLPVEVVKGGWARRYDRLNRLRSWLWEGPSDTDADWWINWWTKWIGAPSNRLLCALFEHSPVRDACGIPEHDYCGWCLRPTPAKREVEQ